MKIIMKAVISIGYLIYLKKNKVKYQYYYVIKEWIRNAFSEVKTSYKWDNQISFYVLENGIRYLIKDINYETFFVIIDKSKTVYQAKIPNKNLKRIIRAIQDTFPENISLSSVRFNMKLHNRFTYKRFTKAQLLSLADWSQKDKKNYYIINKDYTYYGDSKDEIKIVKHIMYHHCAKVLRGQDFSITYGEKKYYPDLVYLNHLNQIVVLEIKAKGDFASESNIKKYIALAKVCREKGFVFGMIDKDFNTYQSYINLRVHKGFEKNFLKVLRRDAVFNSQSLTKLRKNKYPNHLRKTLRKMITKIILDHRLINRPKTVHDLNVLNEKIKQKHYYAIFKKQ